MTFTSSYLDEQKPFDVQEIILRTRLQLRGVGFWITECALLVLAAGSIYLAFAFRSSVVSRDPGSITGVATILARSESTFLGLFRGAGLSSSEVLRKELSQMRFETSTGSIPDVSRASFGIYARARTTDESNETDGIDEEEADVEAKWYRPFIVTATARLLIITSGISLIAVLETVYQLSCRNNKFLTLPGIQYIGYTWKYIPVTIFILVGLASASLDFEIKTFEPFCRMRAGAPASTSVDENYFSYVGIHALWHAASRKQYCVTATSLAIVLSPFLTIFASGLYSAEEVSQVMSIKLSRMDQFDLDSINDIQKIGYQYNGMMTANLVLNDDMVLPQWTYDSFVIPELQGDLQHTFDQTPGSPDDRVKATIPSLQATANCTALDLPSPRFNATTGTLTCTLNPPCGGHSAGKNSSILLNREGAFAAWLDLSGQAYHCPEYVVLAGRRHTDNSVDVTALHCSPYLDRVDIHVALTFPDLKADRNAAPRADESTRAFVTTVEILGIGENLLEPYTDVEVFWALGTVDGFFGALELHDRLRLKQTAASTRALQGLLAVLVLDAAATFLLADTREVLPKNPRSIAAVASLLVGSRMLREIPAGAEWCGDEELRRWCLFEGMVFRMGYWDAGTTEEGVRFGIDVGGGK